MRSLGEELRTQREARQISLREISDVTKIGLRFLEALERDEFARLPGGQFNKGFIRAYCRVIGADPEKMIGAYDAQLRVRGETPGEDTESAVAASQAPRGLNPLQVAVGAAIVLAVVTLALAAWIVWHMSTAHGASAPPAAGQAVLRTPATPNR